MCAYICNHKTVRNLKFLDSFTSNRGANFARNELAGGGVKIDLPLLNKLVSNRRGVALLHREKGVALSPNPKIFLKT
jgi:hypothetical protein